MEGEAYYYPNSGMICAACGFSMEPLPDEHSYNLALGLFTVWRCYWVNPNPDVPACPQHGVKIKVAPIKAELYIGQEKM